MSGYENMRLDTSVVPYACGETSATHVETMCMHISSRSNEDEENMCISNPACSTWGGGL